MPDKRIKASVDFEHPAQGPHHCGECRHYLPPAACRLVDGTVRRVDWCKLYAPHASAEERGAARYVAR